MEIIKYILVRHPPHLQMRNAVCSQTILCRRALLAQTCITKWHHCRGRMHQDFKDAFLALQSSIFITFDPKMRDRIRYGTPSLVQSLTNITE